MIVTIDGPAGAGKSTVARLLARRVRFEFLDTGAMYRAVTLAGLRAQVDPSDGEALQRLLDNLQIVVREGKTFLNGEEVTEAIRTAEVTARIRRFADHPAVRALLTRSQRTIAEGRDLVTEGRDQGTIVFPDAQCKFFLVANETVRAQRRLADFARQGRTVSLEEVLEEQRLRDRQDQERSLAPLVPAPDALTIDTSDLDPTATVELLESLVRKRMG